MQLGGIHHLTAVTARIRDNKRFYTDTLGMRLVKRSVNQDDPSSYHLFYADAKGTPGTDVTFFDWPAARERRGTNSIARTMLRVGGERSLEYWAGRFRRESVAATEAAERDGRLTLDFEDLEGQRLSLVDDGGAGESYPYADSVVPEEHQVRGLGPIVLSVPRLATTDAILQGAMNMRLARTYQHAGADVNVYEMGNGGPSSELHVAEEPTLARAFLGAGGVHHVAFRSRDEDFDGWAERLAELGVKNSGEVDRFWFRSLYFREPNGILFEIASDGPGFGIDETEETLGTELILPPFLEPRRAEIVAGLKPID